jgi:hypothetical protein
MNPTRIRRARHGSLPNSLSIKNEPRGTLSLDNPFQEMVTRAKKYRNLADSPDSMADPPDF